MLSLDILAIIGTFIPAKDLCSFMCVSKAWAMAALTPRTGGMTKINTPGIKADLLKRACQEGLTVTVASLLRDPKANVNPVYSPFEPVGYIFKGNSSSYLDGRTPLTIAISNGFADICRELLSDCRLAPINRNPALLKCAIYNKYQIVIALLLKYGCPVNLSHGPFGYTALHTAAIFGDMGIIHLLLQHGADPHKKTLHGETAIRIAEVNGHVNVVVCLEAALREKQHSEKRKFY